MEARILDGLAVVRSYEDPALQARALATIPVERLTRAANAIVVGDPREHLLRQLLQWFKGEFFCWVDAPPCDGCGGATRSIGAGVPTDGERRRGGGRVELYICGTCGRTVRFVRYRSAGTLLETRRGRCGEWANCFTLCCRALKFEARYVLDWTDHVWTEVWLDSRQRWIHLDPCENAFDKPLIYEVGWGKKLSYVIACAWDHVVDVSQRYTRDIATLRPRRTEISEAHLAALICQINTTIQQRLPRPRLQLLLVRMLLEAIEIVQPRNATTGETIGRQSGSAEWRALRGETGTPLVDVAKLTRGWTDASSLLRSATLNGTATRSADESILLTPRRNDCVGTAFSHAIRVMSGFQIAFSFAIRGDGADGFAFVVQNDQRGAHAVGRGGAELGFGGLTSSVAVEFDAYQNSDACDDPNGNHVSVQMGGSAHTAASAALSTAIPPLRAPGGYDVIVTYVVEDGGALVVQMRPRGQGNYETVLQAAPFILADKFPLDTDGRAYVGFTAATGGLNQEHSILEWSIRLPNV